MSKASVRIGASTAEGLVSVSVEDGGLSAKKAAAGLDYVSMGGKRASARSVLGPVYVSVSK